eukprot:scaffold22443_cov62-Phaeocystis_antarctica.AAC.6
MPATTLESARPAQHPSDFSLLVDLWLVDGSHRSGHRACTRRSLPTSRAGTWPCSRSTRTPVALHVERARPISPVGASADWPRRAAPRCRSGHPLTLVKRDACSAPCWPNLGGTHLFCRPNCQVLRCASPHASATAAGARGSAALGRACCLPRLCCATTLPRKSARGFSRVRVRVGPKPDPNPNPSPSPSPPPNLDPNPNPNPNQRCAWLLEVGFWEHAGRALLLLLSLQRHQLHQPGGAAASDGDADRLAEAAAALQLLTPSVRTAFSPRDVVRCASAQSRVP